MNQQITSKQNNNDAAFPCRCLACGETINVTCGATKVCCCGVCQIAVTATPASEQVILAQRQRLAGSELNRLRLQCQECETRFELDYSKPRSQVMCPTCSQIITLTTEHHKPEIVIAQEQSISPCYYRLQCQLTQCQRQYDHQEQSYREAMMQIDEYRRQRGQIPEQYREGVYLLFHYVSKWQSLPGDYPLYNREVSLFLKKFQEFCTRLGICRQGEGYQQAIQLASFDRKQLERFVLPKQIFGNGDTVLVVETPSWVINNADHRITLTKTVLREDIAESIPNGNCASQRSGELPSGNDSNRA